MISEAPASIIAFDLVPTEQHVQQNNTVFSSNRGIALAMQSKADGVLFTPHLLEHATVSKESSQRKNELRNFFIEPVLMPLVSR